MLRTGATSIQEKRGVRLRKAVLRAICRLLSLARQPARTCAGGLARHRRRPLRERISVIFLDRRATGIISFSGVRGSRHQGNMRSSYENPREGLNFTRVPSSQALVTLYGIGELRERRDRAGRGFTRSTITDPPQDRGFFPSSSSVWFMGRARFTAALRQLLGSCLQFVQAQGCRRRQATQTWRSCWIHMLEAPNPTKTSMPSRYSRCAGTSPRQLSGRAPGLRRLPSTRSQVEPHEHERTEGLNSADS